MHPPVAPSRWIFLIEEGLVNQWTLWNPINSQIGVPRLYTIFIDIWYDVIWYNIMFLQHRWDVHDEVCHRKPLEEDPASWTCPGHIHSPWNAATHHRSQHWFTTPSIHLQPQKILLSLAISYRVSLYHQQPFLHHPKQRPLPKPPHPIKLPYPVPHQNCNVGEVAQSTAQLASRLNDLGT